MPDPSANRSHKKANREKQSKLGPMGLVRVLFVSPPPRNSLGVIKHQPKPFQFQPPAVSWQQACAPFASPSPGQRWLCWSRHAEFPEHTCLRVVRNVGRCTERIDSWLPAWLSRQSPYEVRSHAEFGSILPAEPKRLTQGNSPELQQQKQTKQQKPQKHNP